MEKKVSTLSSTRRVIFAEAGKRLDIFLVHNFPQYSRTYFQKLINQGLVLVVGYSPSRGMAYPPDLEKGSLKRANYKLHPNEKIEVTFPPPETLSAEPQALPLDIIYEDEEIILVNKPPGMVVHPACGHRNGTLVNALLYHLKHLPGSDAMRPGLVHRLDKDTSGIMVVAKTEKALNFLAKQFERRKVDKTYLALVYGIPKENQGKIEAPLGRDLKNRKKVSITSFHGRQALTEYKVVETFPKSKIGHQENASLLEVRPLTGRTHQIRVHLAAVGHPVWGDPQYGGKVKYIPCPRYEPERFIPRMMLHSWKLRFVHPGEKKIVEFSAPLPEDFKEVIGKLQREK